MNKFLPKLKKHLDRNGVDTGIYTLKWFFQCFLDRVRPFVFVIALICVIEPLGNHFQMSGVVCIKRQSMYRVVKEVGRLLSPCRS
jgi:hypothetical protein